MARYILTFVLLKWATTSQPVFAFTANKVAFETLDRGWRVTVEYTVPEIKELRQAFVEFRSYKKAADFYWKLVGGAHFYLTKGGNLSFVNPPADPDPW